MAPSLAPAAGRASGRIGVGERARVRHGHASRVDHRPHRGGPPPRCIAHAASPQPAAQPMAPDAPSIVIQGVVQHRAAARKALTAAQNELAAAERALAQLLGSDQHHTAINKAIPAAETRIATATATTAVTTAKAELKTHPAKLPANTIDPHAQRAHPRTGRRALQMLLRLLAFNAEDWLADRLTHYLQDP